MFFKSWLGAVRHSSKQHSRRRAVAAATTGRRCGGGGGGGGGRPRLAPRREGGTRRAQNRAIGIGDDAIMIAWGISGLKCPGG
jgi:hypothetical protein